MPDNSSVNLRSGEQPSLPRRIWNGWKRVARKIGDFQARVILSVFYFVLLAPFALVSRLSSDSAAARQAAPHGWTLKSARTGTPMEEASKQF
ncbi:MAG TPA: hypothetical protein VIX59_12555 [Candidatus Binataceae bacterium]